jgi:hypothetical protein
VTGLGSDCGVHVQLDMHTERGEQHLLPQTAVDRSHASLWQLQSAALLTGQQPTAFTIEAASPTGG